MQDKRLALSAVATLLLGGHRLPFRRGRRSIGHISKVGGGWFFAHGTTFRGLILIVIAAVVIISVVACAWCVGRACALRPFLALLLLLLLCLLVPFAALRLFLLFGILLARLALSLLRHALRLLFRRLCQGLRARGFLDRGLAVAIVEVHGSVLQLTGISHAIAWQHTSECPTMVSVEWLVMWTACGELMIGASMTRHLCTSHACDGINDRNACVRMH